MGLDNTKPIFVDLLNGVIIMKLKRFMSDTLSFGKGAVKIPSAELIEEFKHKYDILADKGLKFKISVYRLIPSNTIVVHTKVPSETVHGFYYDVLLELTSNGAKDFEECDIKIFSNCPSFVYTYAYVFYHLEDDEAKTKGIIIDQYEKKIPRENLIITGASKKLTEEILHGRPVVRNPYGLPLFDKSVYYAIFNMVDKLDFNSTINNRKGSYIIHICLIKLNALVDSAYRLQVFILHPIRAKLIDKLF